MAAYFIRRKFFEKLFFRDTPSVADGGFRKRDCTNRNADVRQAHKKSPPKTLCDGAYCARLRKNQPRLKNFVSFDQKPPFDGASARR